MKEEEERVRIAKVEGTRSSLMNSRLGVKLWSLDEFGYTVCGDDGRAIVRGLVVGISAGMVKRERTSRA